MKGSSPGLKDPQANLAGKALTEVEEQLQSVRIGHPQIVASQDAQARFGVL